MHKQSRIKLSFDKGIYEFPGTFSTIARNLVKPKPIFQARQSPKKFVTVEVIRPNLTHFNETQKISNKCRKFSRPKKIFFNIY